MSSILKGLQLNEVNPNNYDSDWDYQDAVARSGRSRSRSSDSYDAHDAENDAYEMHKRFAATRARKEAEAKAAAEKLDELSPQTLASYKKKAGADATASDKAGDYKRGDKRMSGIMQATKKEFANDAKGVAETTGDKPFDKMMTTIKQGTNKQKTADRKEQQKQTQQQAHDAFGNMFGGGNPADKLKIREQGVAEGLNEFAMSGGDDGEDPFDNYPCYDCGSTIFLHHTKLCDLAEPNAKHDLPARPGSQHWTGEIPKGLNPILGLQEGSGESVSLRDMVNVVDKHYPKYYAELSGSDISDRQFERAIVNAYKKIMQKQGVAEGQLNELDMFAPVTTFIKMTDGSYIQADWRKSQGNAGFSDSASFINFKPVNPNAAKQLGLDSYQRNNSISNHRDGTIVSGGPIQGSGPLANRGYEVVDYNKPETMKELPPEIKSELIKWVQKQNVVEESCPHCSGPMFSELMINEKKDACYYKVKSRYKVWPSAYASGALVKCRNKGASNWGNGGKKNESSILEGINRADESLHDWFNKEKWVRMDTKGNIKGPCAKEPGEGKPKCLPQSKAHSLGKKGRASAAQRKRREDPNPERSGKAINVDTKKESNESIDENWKKTLGAAALAGSMALGAAGAHARVTPDGQGGFTGGLKPTATVNAPSDDKPAAEAPKGFSKEYLQKAADPNRFGRFLISVEKAQELLKQAPSN